MQGTNFQGIPLGVLLLVGGQSAFTEAHFRSQGKGLSLFGLGIEECLVAGGV